MSAAATRDPASWSQWRGRRYLFHLGRRGVSSYKVMLYVGCVLGIYAGCAAPPGDGLDPNRFALATTALLLPALLGARAWYVLRHREHYAGDPLRVLRTADGGSALYGGLVLSIVVSIPFLGAFGLPFWSFWDAASITMLVGLVVTRLGCIMNGCCAGAPTERRWGVWLPDVTGTWRRRHPTQAMEAAWGATVLAAALVARLALGSPILRFAAVVVAYTLGRSVLEATRQSSHAPTALHQLVERLG
jgi:phosphatidylglycerol:prolipoprotein diacylglycerol transferase